MLIWLRDARPEQVQAWLRDEKWRESWFAFMASIKSNDLPPALVGSETPSVASVEESNRMTLCTSETDSNPGQLYWSCRKCGDFSWAASDSMPENGPTCTVCETVPVECTCKSQQIRGGAAHYRCAYCRSPQRHLDLKEKADIERDVAVQRQHLRVRPHLQTEGKFYVSKGAGNKVPLSLERTTAVSITDHIEEDPPPPLSQACVLDVPGEEEAEPAVAKFERWFGIGVEVAREVKAGKGTRLIPHRFPIVKSVAEERWAAKEGVEVGMNLIGFEARTIPATGDGDARPMETDGCTATGDAAAVCHLLSEGVRKGKRRFSNTYASGQSGCSCTGTKTSATPTATTGKAEALGVRITTNDLNEIVAGMMYLQSEGIRFSLLFASETRRVHCYSLPPEAPWNEAAEDRHAMAVEESLVHEHSQTCYKGRSKCDGCRFRFPRPIITAKARLESALKGEPIELQHSEWVVGHNPTASAEFPSNQCLETCYSGEEQKHQV